MQHHQGVPIRVQQRPELTDHLPKLDTLEKIAKTLFISPAAMITQHLPTNVLMSRRLSRFIDKYASLDADQREKLEDFIENLSDSPSPK